MAQPTPGVTVAKPVIERYGPGMFRVAGQVFDGSILVLSTGAMPWPVRAVADLRPEDFAPVTGQEVRPDILVLGWGSRSVMVAPALRRALRDLGIVIDAMETGAACRTYNILVAEGRRVAAGLIVLE